MNLVFDIGNTRTKWALFDGERLVEMGVGTPRATLLEEKPLQMLTAITGGEEPPVKNCPCLTAQLLTDHPELPVSLNYHTPDTLGADRIAAACGAYMHTHCPCVIIDAGTCIAIDYITSEGIYEGGAILPGLRMKFEALHTFTARLPLLEYDKSEEPIALTGKSTHESIMAGVVAATRLELKGFVDSYCALNSQVRVILTGGDAECLKQNDWEVRPNLVLEGLNWLLNNNIGASCTSKH